MQPRFVGRLGVADAVTVANAALGFLAAAAATVEPELAARLILLAAIADGLDGVVARTLGSTQAGEFLDSLADVASFAVAPAMLAFAVARRQWNLTDPSWATVATFCVPALFVAMAVVRLGLYTTYEVGNEHTVGTPTTLAATVLGAAVLAGVSEPAVLLGSTGVFAYLMVTRVTYPDLYARDALVMGGVQAVAVLAPTAIDRAFPLALLAAALAYLLLGPRFYWRDLSGTEKGVNGRERGVNGRDQNVDGSGRDLNEADADGAGANGSDADAPELEGKRS